MQQRSQAAYNSLPGPHYSQAAAVNAPWHHSQVRLHTIVRSDACEHCMHSSQHALSEESLPAALWWHPQPEIANVHAKLQYYHGNTFHAV